VTHPATITGEARNPLESFSEHFPTLLGAVTKFSEKTFWMSEHTFGHDISNPEYRPQLRCGNNIDVFRDDTLRKTLILQ
jgi:hypothetical protein